MVKAVVGGGGGVACAPVMQHHELNLVARVADDVSRVLERRVLEARARPLHDLVTCRHTRAHTL